MDYLCDIVVLCWNQLNTTKKFVESFFKNTTIPCRVIIIDNASTDGTKDYLLSLKNNQKHLFKIIINNENKGFVKGVNQGIEISDAPYVCLANNDLIFANGWLREIISVFENNNTIGLLNPNSNSLGAVNLENKHKTPFIEMPFCIGFCMVIKRDVINKVGGLSEEFQPMFFEDSDYSMKVVKAGYRIGMAQNSYVQHEEHKSLDAIGKKRKEEIFTKSKETFLKKWGEILRISYIATNNNIVSPLNECITIARGGNFVWFFSKYSNKDKPAIFQQNNLDEHTGVNFVLFQNLFQAVWKIIKKKKKYDIIICSNKSYRLVFNKIGYKTLEDVDKNVIEQMKKHF